MIAAVTVKGCSRQVRDRTTTPTASRRHRRRRRSLSCRWGSLHLQRRRRLPPLHRYSAAVQLLPIALLLSHAWNHDVPTKEHNVSGNNML